MTTVIIGKNEYPFYLTEKELERFRSMNLSENVKDVIASCDMDNLVALFQYVITVSYKGKKDIIKFIFSKDFRKIFNYISYDGVIGEKFMNGIYADYNERMVIE